MNENSRESKRGDVIEIPVGKYVERMRKNPWIAASIVLAIALVIVIFFKSSNNVLVVSETEAGAKVLGLAKAQLGGDVQLGSVEKSGNAYKVLLTIQGKSVPVLVSLDGQYLLQEIANTGSGSGNEKASSGGKIEVSLDDDAVLGNANAPVTIVEFSDYQCPFCRKFWTETFSLIKKDYIDTGKVKLIYRDFPLSNLHPAAQASAEAAECVREKGGDSAYWKFHDKVFEEQNILDSGSKTGAVTKTVQYGETELKKWAKDLGYDISSCLDSGKYASEVQKDQADGSSYGVQGTPAFFINGRFLEGAQSYSAMKQIIDSELDK